MCLQSLGSSSGKAGNMLAGELRALEDTFVYLALNGSSTETDSNEISIDRIDFGGKCGV